MNNHNNTNSGHDGHKHMTWMMIPCLLLLGFLFLGGSKLFSSGYLWLLIIGICVVPHIWMMFKGHGGHGDTDTEGKENAVEESKTKDEHKKSGCCH
ncbi:MAG: DUF2933 domain-containing protein [bacterium]|nr:DUF2933 domain-containing protein [bacterium]